MALRGPFPKLDLALKDSFDRGRVPVYAEDCGSGGTKQYWSGDYESFFEKYQKMTPRHYYEVIREDLPCHLHLDLEHERPLGVALSDDEIIAKVRDAVLDALVLAQFASQPLDVDVVRIDSSSLRKFSCHLIFALDDAAFANNYHCGAFMREFPKDAFPSVEKPDGGRASVVDLAIYTKHRCFRLVGSSKRKDPGRVLVVAGVSFERAFFSSLIQNMSSEDPKLLRCTERDGSEPRSGFGPKGSENIVPLNRDLPPIAHELAEHIETLWSDGNVLALSYNEERKSIFFATTSHKCVQKGRSHRGNRVYFCATLKPPRWRQGCHDEEYPCANADGTKNWSAWYSFPEGIEKRIEGFLSDNLEEQDEKKALVDEYLKITALYS